MSIKNVRNLKKVVGAAGFEPTTLWSQTRCATKLRYAPYVLFKVVGAAGFEPTTLWSQTRCATKLRYAPTVTLNFHFFPSAGSSSRT